MAFVSEVTVPALKKLVTKLMGVSGTSEVSVLISYDNTNILDQQIFMVGETPSLFTNIGKTMAVTNTTAVALFLAPDKRMGITSVTVPSLGVLVIKTPKIVDTSTVTVKKTVKKLMNTTCVTVVMGDAFIGEAGELSTLEYAVLSVPDLTMIPNKSMAITNGETVTVGKVVDKTVLVTEGETVTTTQNYIP